MRLKNKRDSSLHLMRLAEIWKTANRGWWSQKTMKPFTSQRAFMEKEKMFLAAGLAHRRCPMVTNNTSDFPYSGPWKPLCLTAESISTHLGLHPSALHALGSNHDPLLQDCCSHLEGHILPSAPASPTTKLSTAVTRLPFSSRLNSLWPQHLCTHISLSCLLCCHPATSSPFICHFLLIQPSWLCDGSLF